MWQFRTGKGPFTAQSGFNKEARDPGLLAVAKVDVKAFNQATGRSRQDPVFGNTRITDPSEEQMSLGVVPKGSRLLTSSTSNMPAGFPTDGSNHAEYLIINYVANVLKNNRNAAGKIDLMVEKPSCRSSCINAIAEFRELHPNIRLNILHNKDQRLKGKGLAEE